MHPKYQRTMIFTLIKIKISKNDFTEKRRRERVFALFPQCGVEKQEILSHQKNISSNQLSSYLFSKTATFTKFLPKMREREFP